LSTNHFFPKISIPVSITKLLSDSYKLLSCNSIVSITVASKFYNFFKFITYVFYGNSDTIPYAAVDVSRPHHEQYH
jgi:hypothetical protein